MRLTLHNFRIYKDKVFEFSEEPEVTLIHGASAIGKSTIMKAIWFAICGGKHMKGGLITKGEKGGCSVILEYKSFRIQRTQKPYSVSFVDYSEGETEHVDEVADARIANIFGGRELFPFTNYMPQKSDRTFIGATGEERLNIIRSITFMDGRCEVLAEKVKNALDDTKRILDDKKSELSVYEKKLPEKRDSPEEVKDPQLLIDENEKKKEELRVELDKIENTRKENIKLRDKINRRLIIEAQCLTKKQEHDELGVFEMDSKKMERELEVLNTKKEKMMKFKDIESKKLRDSQVLSLLIKQAENNQRIFELELEKEGIGPVTEEIKSQEGQEVSMKEMSSVILSKSKIPANMQNMTATNVDTKIEELENKKRSSKVQNCPFCHKGLIVSSGVIKKSDDPSLSPVSFTTQDEQLLKTLKSLLPVFRELEGRPYCDKPIAELKAKMKELEVSIKKEQEESIKRIRLKLLNDEIRRLSSACRSSAEGAETTEVDIEVLRTEFELSKEFEKLKKEMKHPEEDIVTEVSQLTENIQKKRSQEKLAIKLKEIEAQLSSIPKVELLAEKSEEEEKEIRSTFTFVCETLRLLYQQKDQYTDYQRKLKEYTDYITALRELENVRQEQQKMSSRYTLLASIRDKIKVAEGEILEEALDIINTRVNEYVEKILNLGLQVKITSFKPTKTTGSNTKPKKTTGSNTKPKIDVALTLNGEDVEADYLSGGERDRLDLCILLALNKSLGNPLFLDESFSSLDAQNTETVVSFLKSLQVSVFLIAHQCIAGQFDHVVPL